MKFFKHISRISKKRGFTLLLAALVSSIALSLGTSIYTIVSKEILLSSIGRNSQFAFYAADTGAECALFWDERSDIHPNTFATSSASQGTAASVMCDNVSAPVTIASASANAATSTFEVALFQDVAAGGFCTDVTVAKFIDGTGAVRTYVDVNGYNVACNAIAGSPNALQRSVQLQY
ncbi:MAG TPA: hypothetical protein VMU25_00975 [Candidatus Paceibacterota bacterium]|nr:hypothetical protein [Candidatus Paceibacterota bacterium]